METWLVILVRAFERIVRAALRTWGATLRLCLLVSTVAVAAAVILRA